MSRSSQGEPSRRQLRVGEQVRHVLFEIFRRSDMCGHLTGSSMMTVSEVRMSPDLKIAKIFVSFLGDCHDRKKMLDMLNANSRFIRGRISPALRKMRYMPELHFYADDRSDRVAQIDKLFNAPEVRNDLLTTGNTQNSFLSEAFKNNKG